MIKQWIVNQDKILNANFKRARSQVQRDRIAHFPIMEESLKSWILEERAANRAVTGVQIKTRALVEFSKHYLDKTFAASDGWLQRFLMRNNFTYRRVTTTGRELPSNTNSLIGKFFVECNALFSYRGARANLSKVWNMDESSIYLG